APDPDTRAMFRYLHLDFVPPRFHARGEVPPNTRFFRARRPDEPPEELPAWITDLRGADLPTLLVCFGTMAREPRVLMRIVRALRDEPVNVVLATGAADQFRIAPFGARKGSLIVESWVPQCTLLPHVDAFVCHAGYNSVKESVDAGVPLLLMPLF